MTSLSSLKDKLHKLKKDDTSEVTDYRTWMKKITDCGNKPEDWLEYTNYMRQHVNFYSKIQEHNFLSDLYENAFRAIDVKENRLNEAFAHLFINFAEVKSCQLPEDAIHLLTEARIIMKKFAVVHIALAELEIKEGDTRKAKKILDKARLLGAEPRKLVMEALRKLESGETILMSKNDRKYNKQNTVIPSPPWFNSKENTTTSQNISHNVDGLTYGCQKEKCGPDETETAPIMLETLKEKHLSARAHSCRPSMRSYNSTPEIRNSEKSQWKRKDIGLPQRVRKLNLPFTAETEEEEGFDEMDTMAGFTALEPQASSTLALTSMARSSGYQSMMDTTMSMESEKCIETCEISKIEPSRHSKPVLTDISKDDYSLVKPEKPEIILEPVLSNQTPGRSVSVNQLPSHQHVSVNQLSSHQHVSVNATPSHQLSLSLNPTQSHQLSVNPTPSKNLSSQMSCNPVCATPSVNSQQQPVSLTQSSVMQDMETITVNNVVYMILEMIGRGGSSKVYHVADSKPPSKAIKVVNLTDTNEEIINGYKNEIKLLSQLQYCPKVIKLYDYEYRPEEDKLFIVMECGNHDFAKLLKDTIQEDGKISHHLIKYYWESMLMAVNALHKEGIIHSDLKPSNFIIIGGKLKLIDFGIAKSVQPDKTSVMTDTQVGTLNYMSPESIMDYCDSEDKPVYKIGVKSDVWSLGCILYNMVYGYTPFQRIVKQFAKLQAIINPNYIIQFPEIEDKLLMDVMKKCLTRDQSVRPGIEELLNHPYLISEKKEAEKPKAVEDYKIERLVQKLADKFASSPNTVRSLVRSEIQKDTPDREPLKSLNLQDFL